MVCLILGIGHGWGSANAQDESGQPRSTHRSIIGYAGTEVAMGVALQHQLKKERALTVANWWTIYKGRR